MIIMGLIIGGLICLIGWRIYYLTIETKGKNRSKEAERSALLVIDMQQDVINQPYYSNRNQLTTTITHAIANATEQHVDPIFITHSIKRHPIDSLLTAGKMQEGSSGTGLIQELTEMAKTVFNKHRADAFSNQDFEDYLIQERIQTLYLVGADASACVYRTALGAVNRGYETIVLEDGLFAASDKQRKKMLTLYEKKGITISNSSRLAT